MRESAYFFRRLHLLASGVIILSMQAESLEVLEKADVPSVQARAIVRAIEIEIAGSKDTLATRHDLLQMRQDLHQELGELRHELHKELGTVHQAMAELRGEFRSELHGMASSITRQM